MNLRLLSRPDVRRLVISSMVARLPSAMLPLVLLLLVHERTGSLAAAGLVVGGFGLGRAVVSPAIGALVDRHGQPRVLIVGASVQAVLLLCLLVAVEAQPLVGVMAVLAAAAGSATPPVQACLRALWPVVAVDDADREAAYSFDATSQELIWIAAGRSEHRQHFRRIGLWRSKLAAGDSATVPALAGRDRGLRHSLAVRALGVGGCAFERARGPSVGGRLRRLIRLDRAVGSGRHDH